MKTNKYYILIVVSAPGAIEQKLREWFHCPQRPLYFAWIDPVGVAHYGHAESVRAFACEQGGGEFRTHADAIDYALGALNLGDRVNFRIVDALEQNNPTNKEQKL